MAGSTVAQVRAKAAAAVAAVLSASEAQLRAGNTAIRAFQQVWGQGLAVDGIYGPATRAALIQVTGATNLPAPPGRSGAFTGGGGGSSLPVPSEATPVVAEEAPVDASTWLLPVGIVSIVVITAGVIIMRRRRAVKANRRRRMRRNPKGVWMIPQRGETRFKTKAQAQKLAKHFKAFYGPGVFDAKVVAESSRSRPGATSYQVYIKPLQDF